MERQPLYFTILILSIMIGSCFYVSYVVDRGMGEVSVERLSIESFSNRTVEFLVYSPRSAIHVEPMPAILTIHGLTGTKEGLYAFNVELARRNFTVVSVDLPGHGDSSLGFDITNFTEMAQDAYAALRYVQTTYPSVNDSYGVLTHSLGFRVAIELEDFPITPMAYVAVGDVGKISQDEFVDFPQNLLFAMGSMDEIVTRQDALQALRIATGVNTAVEDVTYGSLDAGTAYRLVFAPSNHVFEAVSRRLVTEAISWMVQGVLGEDQLEHTYDSSDQVIQYRTPATILASFLILVSVIPVMWLLYNLLPERLKPRQTSTESKPFNTRRTFMISSIFGSLTVLIFAGSSLLGLTLEDTGIYLLNSMSTTGLVLFFLLGAAVLSLVMFILREFSQMWELLGFVDLKKSNIKDYVYEFLKNLVVALGGVLWVLIWVGVASASQTSPSILLLLVKWPIGIRWVNVVLLTCIIIPFLLVEATWIRALMMSENVFAGRFNRTTAFIFTLISKFAVIALLSILVIIGTTAAGVSGGRIVLLSVIWVRILLIQVLATVILAWTEIEFKNTWSAIMVSAFILSLVMITTVPLI
ncbi:MAG: alpha/beta hydrolase [Candidatus Thorarchaeota archaeon]